MSVYRTTKTKISNMNFAELKDKIEEATRQAFLEMFEKHGKEEIYAFALYSDDGAMTVCPSTNTMTHLTSQDDWQDDLTCKYGPAEWKYECEGADDLFDEICELCRNEFSEKERDEFLRMREDKIDQSKIGKFRVQLYETCIEVLEKLKSENFFKQIVGKDIFLYFTVSDGFEFSREKWQEVIIRLNDNEYRDEYLAWMETWPW